MSASGSPSTSSAAKLPFGPESPYALLRSRDFVLYLVGRFAASLGQQMLTVAVSWELYERTHSALALGLVGLTNMVAMFVFTLPAGHIAENRNRKRIIVAMTGVMALASAGLAVGSASRAPTFWIYACLFTAAVARTFLWPANSSFLIQLVSRPVFPRAVAWSTGGFHLSSVAGPAAGGVILAWAGRAAPVYLINCATALTCLLLIACVHYRPAPAAREPMTRGSLVAGFKFVFASRVIFGIITLDLFAVLLGGATALLPVFAKDILHAGPSGLGWLQAALPMGSLLSAIVLAHRPPLEKAGRALLWAVTGFGLATIGFAFSTAFAFSFGMLFLCGATDNVSVVVRQTLVQLLTPDDKRGRVSAVNSLFIGTSNELGGFESGLVAHWFGPVVSAASGGLGTLLAVLAVAWIWPEIRRYGRLVAHEPPSPAASVNGP